MTWKMTRVYRCSLCEREEFSRGESLPLGWSGNDDERGDCYCDDCRHKLDWYTSGRAIPLDGDPRRLVCTTCGSSFDAESVSVYGKVVPSRCPKCHAPARDNRV